MWRTPFPPGHHSDHHSDAHQTFIQKGRKQTFTDSWSKSVTIDTLWTGERLYEIIKIMYNFNNLLSCRAPTFPFEIFFTAWSTSLKCPLSVLERCPSYKDNNHLISGSFRLKVCKPCILVKFITSSSTDTICSHSVSLKFENGILFLTKKKQKSKDYC